MYKLTHIIILFLVQSTFMSPVLAQCDPGEMKIKFSHVTNTHKHPKGIAASMLEKRVNDEMNGLACMQVYPNSSLYDDNKVLEAILNGDVQLAAPSLSKFDKFTHHYRLFDLPFLFEDIFAVERFQRSAAGIKLKNAMNRKGIKGLAFWHNGMKQISSIKPILTPSDIKGMKFRVQASDVLVAQFHQLGASAQKMPLKDVYGALHSRVVDGQENTWSNIYGMRLFELQNGVTETNHGILEYLLVTSTEWWDGLPENIKSRLQTIIEEVTLVQNMESFRINAENKAKIIESGVKVRALTSEQRQLWLNALQPIWKKFESEIGPNVIIAAQAANSNN